MRVQDKYKAFIHAIPLERFCDRSMKVMIETKYFHAKGTSADGLLTKANKVLKKFCIMAAGMRGIGTPLHQIPRGRSLMDMRNQFILSKWSEVQGTVYILSNNDDELMAQIPDGWWLLNPTTYLLLAVPVHRCNPDIIANTTLWKETHADTVKRREKDKIVELHATGHQQVEELMLQSKAQLMAQILTQGQSSKSRSSLYCCHNSRSHSSRFEIALMGREKKNLMRTPMTFSWSCHS